MQTNQTRVIIDKLNEELLQHLVDRSSGRHELGWPAFAAGVGVAVAAIVTVVLMFKVYGT